MSISRARSCKVDSSVDRIAGDLHATSSVNRGKTHYYPHLRLNGSCGWSGYTAPASGSRRDRRASLRRDNGSTYEPIEIFQGLVIVAKAQSLHARPNRAADRLIRGNWVSLGIVKGAPPRGPARIKNSEFLRADASFGPSREDGSYPRPTCAGRSLDSFATEPSLFRCA